MNKLVWMGVAGCALASVARAQAPAGSPAMLGYDAPAAQVQAGVEQRFDGELDRAQMQGWLQQMSSAPNHVGSPKDRENAEFMLQRLREWGWDARLERFDILYPTPRAQSLELVAPTTFRASLREPPLAEDPTTRQNDAALPPYNVYGADGDVTAELVYVNHGMPEDYRELAREGVDVTGKIVIARYEGGWRGLKPKLAHDHGAVGCIIYSDPGDDGYAQGEPYPAGGWRPAAGVQRGSVLDTPLYPGDPLTPGIPATADAKRLARSEAPTLPAIPVLPISSADAQPLLAALRGRVVPAAWRGGLPLTYRFGPGPARVHLAVQSDWRITPIYDVIATVPGAQEPDQWVLRGNHHDGWTYGAWDPLSGNTALLAEAKAIGALLKTGWRPRRTLVYASWDAEEPGWIGSTEWVEAHLDELQRKGVVYVNSDTNARGFLHAGGAPALQRLVSEIAGGVSDPETGASVLARKLARQAVNHYEGHPGSDEPDAAHLTLGALGAGSDFTAFIDHAGLAALDLFFMGEDAQYGAYHSDYDTFEHFRRFGDPSFGYELAESQLVGHLVLRMADAPLLPMQFSDMAGALQREVQDLHALAEQHRQQGDVLRGLLATHGFALAGDPAEPLAPPTAEAPMPAIAFEPLDQAVADLTQSARAYDAACERALAGPLPDAARLQAINTLLQGIEGTLTDPAGLPRRPWFRHQLYAPGRFSGYSAKTLPAVREALELGLWDEANRGIGTTAAAITRYRQRLDQASALLTPAR